MKHRLFIAIDIPETVRKEIIVLQKKLDDLKLPILWESSDKLHLTLHFLGATPNDQMQKLASPLRQTLAGFRQFSLTPYFLETLYRRHESSLIYLGLQGDLSDLKELQKSLGNLLTDFHLPAQNRFLPHITIGKLKRDDPINTKNFLAKIDEVEIRPLSQFNVDHISLYESFLSSAGSHYQKVGQFGIEYG